MDKELREKLEEHINTLNKRNTGIEIDRDSAEEYICQCGNNSGDSGFETCDKNGNYMEPLADSCWDGHYICLECGLIFRIKD